MEFSSAGQVGAAPETTPHANNNGTGADRDRRSSETPALRATAVRLKKNFASVAGRQSAAGTAQTA
eukprot:1897009-Pyramimonas_sp.AAC.1